MKPVFDAARRAPKRLILAEGAHPYVLQAAAQIIQERIARPILIGFRDDILRAANHLGLRIKPEKDYDIVDPKTDNRMDALAEDYLPTRRAARRVAGAGRAHRRARRTRRSARCC